MRPLPLCRPHVSEDREQEEETRQNVAALGGPDHRLNAEWVEGPEQGRRRGAETEHSFACRLDRSCQKPPGHHKEESGVGSVDREIRQVIPDGVQPPRKVVEREAQPGERNPLPAPNRMRRPSGRQHPPELDEAESAKVGIRDEIDIVVPDETVAQRRQKEETGEYADGEAPPDIDGWASDTPDTSGHTLSSV